MKINGSTIKLTVSYASRLNSIAQFRALVDEIFSNQCVKDRQMAIRIANKLQENPTTLEFNI